jgi:Ca2+/Na+ antiporter
MIWGFYKEIKLEGFAGYLSAVRDPLLFRFDSVVMILMISAALIAVIGAILQTLPNIIANPTSYLIATVVVRIGFLVGAWGFITLAGLASCILIIKRKLTKAPEVDNESTDAYGQLRAILKAHGDKRRLFETFCKGEFCYGNII